MKNSFLLILLMLFLLSCGGVEETDNDSDETEDIETSDSDTFDGSEVIKFKDVNLEKCVRTRIQKPEGDITVEDVKNVKLLDCPRMNIKVLDGIEKLPNVSELSFYENDIVDLSILKNIETLKVLRIEHNKNINPNTLSELIDLEELHVQYCESATVDSVKNLHRLKVLNISSNNINSLNGLENLTGLKSIYINENYLKNDDLPVLLNLVNLEHLNVEYNCINDFSVIDQMLEKNPEMKVVKGGLNDGCR